MAVGDTYQHSGKFTFGGLAMAAASSAVGGLIAGAVYGVVDQVNPFIYINALGAIVAGVAAGACASFGANAGKVRNPTVVGVAGLLGGLACLWASWVAWVWALTDWNVIGWDPNVLWFFIQLVNAKGAWSMKGSTPTGGFLWFIWACEALLILGPAFFTAWMALDDAPFCEQCGVWADKETKAVLATPEDIPALVKGIESGDFAGLAALERGDDGGVSWVEAKIQACPRQGAPYYLTVVGKARSKNAKGEEEVKEFSLVKLLEVDEKVSAIIDTGGAPPTAAPPPEEAAAPEEAAPEA